MTDPAELAYLQVSGDYGSNPARSGKYFALTIAGARAFAAAPINAASSITETTLPQSVVDIGFAFIDPGQQGAGRSVFFSELQLAAVYGAMTPPVMVPSAGRRP